MVINASPIIQRDICILGNTCGSTATKYIVYEIGISMNFGAATNTTPISAAINSTIDMSIGLQKNICAACNRTTKATTVDSSCFCGTKGCAINCNTCTTIDSTFVAAATNITGNNTVKQVNCYIANYLAISTTAINFVFTISAAG